MDYDFDFEKRLASSLEAVEPLPSGSAKKRKAVTRNNGDAMSQGRGEGSGEGSGLDDMPHKRQRAAKGKARLAKYDWSDDVVRGDSDDEDYNPS